jgi:hypothetical protein
MVGFIVTVGVGTIDGLNVGVGVTCFAGAAVPPKRLRNQFAIPSQNETGWALAAASANEETRTKSATATNNFISNRLQNDLTQKAVKKVCLVVVA